MPNSEALSSRRITLKSGLWRSRVLHHRANVTRLAHRARALRRLHQMQTNARKTKNTRAIILTIHQLPRTTRIVATRRTLRTTTLQNTRSVRGLHIDRRISNSNITRIVILIRYRLNRILLQYYPHLLRNTRRELHNILLFHLTRPWLGDLMPILLCKLRLNSGAEADFSGNTQSVLPINARGKDRSSFLSGWS